MKIISNIHYVSLNFVGQELCERQCMACHYSCYKQRACLQSYSVRLLYIALQASLEQVCTYMTSEFHFITNHVVVMYLNIYVLLNYIFIRKA
jgi:hypothetical protein